MWSILIPVPVKGTIDIGWQVLHRCTALIPVPMKGTITVYYDIVKPLMSFNPRTHEGYDHDFFTNEKLPFNSFNPRTREGYDTIDRGVNVSIYHFNPRTHEGYDMSPPGLIIERHLL